MTATAPTNSGIEKLAEDLPVNHSTLSNLTNMSNGFPIEGSIEALVEQIITFGLNQATVLQNDTPAGKPRKTIGLKLGK